MSIQNKLHDISLADWTIQDPGDAKAISPAKDGICDIVTTAAQTRTLAAPYKEGVFLFLNFLTDGGDCTITVASAIDGLGTTTITLANAGDFVQLVSRKFGTVYRWKVVNSNVNGLILEDDAPLTIGTGSDVKLAWDTTDANANLLKLQMPTGTSVNVPVLFIGQGIKAVDQTIYDGSVDPYVVLFGFGAVATGAGLDFRKARGTAAAPTVVTSADDLGTIRGYACVAAGEWRLATEIKMECTGTPATTRSPGVITLSTANDATSSALAAALVIGANQVIVPQSGFTPKSLSASAITTTRVLTVQDSGGVFSVAKTSAYAITLPTPAQGIRFKFLVLDTGANAVTISDGSAHLFGVASVNNVNVAMSGTTLSLAASGSVGDWVEFEGIDATHYLVTGACIAAGKITIA